MNKDDYIIIYSPNQEISDDEIKRMTDHLNRKAFFVMPQYNDKDDDFMAKIAYKNIVLNLKVSGYKYNVIEDVEKFNFELVDDLFNEINFDKWLKKNKIAIRFFMKSPVDEEVRKINEEIKETNEAEFIYILYPGTFGKEYYKIGYLINGRTVVRIRTKWRYLNEVWKGLPQLHSQFQQMNASNFEKSIVSVFIGNPKKRIDYKWD